MKTSELKNQRIIVVGGSSGIGLQLCVELVAIGADVVVASRSADKLAVAKSTLNNKVITHELDASDEQAVIRFFSMVGTFDHVVVTIKPDQVTGGFRETSSSHVRQAFEAKFWGQYFLARHCLSTISREGSILLTSGIASHRGYTGFSGIAAINGAVESLVKTLAVELAPIRVNAVCPGFIERFRHDLDRFNVLKESGIHIPLERVGTHEDVAEGYLFLLQNQYSSGTILPIDGGALCA